jgi:hypothetical protein
LRFRKVAVLAFSTLVSLAGQACAQDFRIGAIFPLSAAARVAHERLTFRSAVSGFVMLVGALPGHTDGIDQ